MSFLNYEKENNKLLVALRTQKEYAPMVDVLTREKTAAILAPQDVTIEEAILNQDFVQTHLVLFNPSDERQFVSLNGVQGLLSLGYDELFILSPGLQSSEERIRFFHDSYSVFSSPSVYDRASDDKFVRSCPRIQVLRVSSMDFRGQTVDLLVIAQPIPHVVTGTSHVSSLSNGSHSSVSSNSSVSSSSSSSSVTAAMEVQSRPVLPSHTDVADDMENPLALSKRAAEGAFGTRECIAAIKKHEEVMTKISNFCNTLLSLAGPNSSMDADAAAVHSFLLSLENSFTTVFPEDPAVCADGSSPPLSTASSTSSMSSTSTVGSSAVSETIDPPHSPGITHNRDSLRDVYRDAVERLVMRRLHDHFSDVFRRKDAEIFDHCETLLARLKPEHILLDAPIDVTEDAVQKAIRELRRIPNFKTPRDRSICITNCCRLLFTVLGHGAGADEFFPLLTYCVMQARVPSWLSTLWYIEKLRHPLRIGGEHEYYLASTRSAVVFLQSMNVDEVIRKDEEHRARKRMLQPVLGIVYGATTSSSTPSSKEDSQDFLHIHPATKFEDLSIAELRTVWERYVQIEKWLRPYK